MAAVDLEGPITGSGTLAAPLAYTNKLSGGVASAATVFIASGLVSIVGAFGQPLFGQMIFGTETEVPLVLELDGEVGGSGVLAASLAVGVRLEGGATAGGTFSATATAQRDLAGAVSGGAALAGGVEIVNALAGDVSATSALTADATLDKPLAGAIVGSGVVAGEIYQLRPAPTLKTTVEVQGVKATVSVVAQPVAAVELVSEIKISLAA